MSCTECCSPGLDIDFGSSLKLSNPITDPVNVPFRFRDLPKELRFMVYEYALSFDSIDKYCSDYLELLCATSNTKEPAPDVEKACPSVLLISKDITEEALPILYKTPLNLSFGIFKAHLEDLIAPDLLRKLRHINLSDVGTRRLDTPPHDCFGGICYAVTELATTLRSGHSLKSFTLDYTSAYLSFHLKTCLPQKRDCGIKSWAHNMIRALKELHSIDKVSLTVDFAEDVKQEIISCMRGPARGFFSLPLHIRREIYSYAADVNDGARAFQIATKQLAFNQDPTFKQTTTPTIFLLNKQIEQEASQTIYTKPFILKNLYPMVNATFLNPTDFFSIYTFKKIQHLRLHLTDHNHLSILPSIASILRRRHKTNMLKSLHLQFSEPRSKRLILAVGEFYPDNAVYTYMRHLNHLRGVVANVSIEGSLPDCFAAAVVHNMGLRVGEEGVPVMVRNGRGQDVDVHVVQGTAFYRKQRGVLVEPADVMEIE